MRIIVSAVLAWAVLLSACGSDATDLEQRVASLEADRATVDQRDEIDVTITSCASQAGEDGRVLVGFSATLSNASDETLLVELLPYTSDAHGLSGLLARGIDVPAGGLNSLAEFLSDAVLFVVLAPSERSDLATLLRTLTPSGTYEASDQELDYRARSPRLAAACHAAVLSAVPLGDVAGP